MEGAQSSCERFAKAEHVVEKPHELPRDALTLWRGPALADVGAVAAVAAVAHQNISGAAVAGQAPARAAGL
jgi:hypothetical protein